MEDKVFDLMTKFYSEFSEFRQEVKNDIVRLENKVDNSSRALFDGYKQTYEKLVEVEKMLIKNPLEWIIKVEIKVLSGVK